MRRAPVRRYRHSGVSLNKRAEGALLAGNVWHREGGLGKTGVLQGVRCSVLPPTISISRLGGSICRVWIRSGSLMNGM